jgi:serine phosphatase RsbU (regulator of sigma subunit)
VMSLPGDRWSAIVVPVYSNGRVIGVVTLVSNEWAGHPPDDVRMAAEGLAGRAGVALANARRFEAEHRMARLLAEALLPAQVPLVPGFSAAARYIPAEGPVAGDWFDVTRLPTGEFLIGVGDAAGHGVSATSLMALLRSAAQGLSVAGHSPAGVLEGLSKLVAEQDDDSFATALYASLDVSSGKLQWSSAGHIPPLSFLGHRATFISDAPNPPLGLGDGFVWDAHDLQVEPGQGLVLVTDGVVDRRGSTLHQGMQRLAEVVEAAAPRSAEQVADRIATELCQMPEDDCCIVVIVRDADA